MTRTVIHHTFTPLRVLELPGWIIRLNSADEDGTLTGELVGDHTYRWVFHPASDAVTVSSEAPGFRYGLPAPELQKPLWSMIRNQG